MKHTRYAFVLLICVLAGSLSVSSQRLLPLPKSVLGFDPGQERHLATWDQITEYLTVLADASPRIQVRELGRSTLGRPLIVATITSEANQKKLDRFKEIQHLLADPRLIVDDRQAERLVDEGKVIVVINCSLHSTEIVSSLMALELAYRLASDHSAETQQILDNTIILLFPSINPDGIDIVGSWYQKTLDTPFEGTAPPELYHHYAGHDNNRDWFMLTQVETQLVTNLLYHEWFPQIVYDVHQMSPFGARMFVPPFYDPPNPNIEALILRQVGRIGLEMATGLTAAGYKGVLTNAQYTTWWQGGFRTSPYYHNMIGILSEAASARLMSPIEIRRHQLQGNGAGFTNPLERRTNFPDPWPGGLWQPRDILDMELVAARSLLVFAARFKRETMMNFYRLGRKAIELGRTQPPFAYLISSEQHDPATAARLINILIDQGVEVQQARRSFVVDGVRYPAGTFVILMSQPYRACAKSLLEVQRYPESDASRDGRGGPYDIAGWTLSLQMGVRAIEISQQFEADLRKIERAAPPDIGLDQPAEGEEGNMWVVRPRANNAFAMVNEVLSSDAPLRVGRLKEDIEVEEKVYERGSFIFFPETERPAQVRGLIADLGLKYYVKVNSLASVPPEAVTGLSLPRIGLYRSWVPTVDEGWTRWVLDQYGFTYETVRDADLQAGNLIERFDVIILPDQPPREMVLGHAAGKYPQQYSGGMGSRGVRQLESFVEAGGVLVCQGRACLLALERFNVPVRNVSGLDSPSEFFCPGSVLAIEIDNQQPLAYGMPSSGVAFFRNSLAFELLGPSSPSNTRVVARYASENVLESGFLRGEDHIAGRPALLDVRIGRGRLVLVGFPSQHRGQTHGTFKFLFNAIQGAMAGNNHQ